MKYLLIVSFFIALTSNGLLAQTSGTAPSSVDPNPSFYNVTSSKSAKSKKVKKSKTKSPNVYYDQKIREYEDRMKKNAKASRKMEKKMMKPQYSDQTYFGHKRPPKKRKPGKRKFCKECGIVH